MMFSAPDVVADPAEVDGPGNSCGEMLNVKEGREENEGCLMGKGNPPLEIRKPFFVGVTGEDVEGDPRVDGVVD